MRGTRPYAEWVQTRPRNEALDCWKYALAALRLSGIDLRARAARPAICVSNHRGFMDSILLLGLLPRTGVLIKARDTRQPTYGFLARHFDLVSVDRHSMDSISTSLDRCRQILAQAGYRLFRDGYDPRRWL